MLLLVGAVVLPPALLTSGCGGSKQRKVDVAAGEYYSEDEIAEFSNREKNQYCADLGTERTRAQQEFEAKTQELKELRDLIDSIRAQTKPVERDVLRLEAEIRTLNDQINEVKSLPTTWTVGPDQTLSIISGLPEIYNDIDKWWKIFEANQDKIDDPFYVFPDTVLVIPRDWPTD
jgi:nucleoid-associated protein YgaU